MAEREFENESEGYEMEFQEKTLLIDTEKISDYLFSALPDFGLVPTRDETDLLADLFFDYLVEISFIEDIDELEE